MIDTARSALRCIELQPGASACISSRRFLIPPGPYSNAHALKILFCAKKNGRAIVRSELFSLQGVKIVRGLSSILVLVAFVSTASAQPAKEGVIRIGVLTDLAGPLADWAGQGSVEAAALAVQDYEKSGGRYRVEILSADHQNRPDVATLVARK